MATINSSKLCSGTTKSGEKCRKHPCSGFKYCWFHRSQNQTTQDMVNPRFNEDCPICLGNEEQMLILSCLHRIHRECAEGLKDSLCPICRKDVSNWPEDLLEKISKNEKDRQEQLTNEETQHLQEQEEQFRSILSHLTMFLQPPPQIEIASAFQFLRGLGIPHRYVPERISNISKEFLLKAI
jgi:hypothetical protein